MECMDEPRFGETQERFQAFPSSISLRKEDKQAQVDCNQVVKLAVSTDV